MQECERPNIERAESEFKVAELRVQHLQQRIAKSDSAEDRAALKVELGRAIEERQAVVVPAIPYLSVDDDTPDKLAQELANQKGRLLVASAEPKALENISLYGDQVLLINDHSFFVKGGDNQYKIRPSVISVVCKICST